MNLKNQDACLEEKVSRGTDIEIHVIFVRHGKRSEEGLLTGEGIDQARKYGKSLYPKEAIKGYSSPIQRVIDTTENIIEAAQHEKKLKTRIRNQLSISSFSEEFNKEFLRQREIGNCATDWYFSLGNNRFDAKSPTYLEAASGLAYLIKKAIRTSSRLNQGSNIDLVNGTHGNMPECLLKEVMIRYLDGKKVRGFGSVQDIGGTLNFAEAVDFAIERNSEGKSQIRLHFRGKEYEVDIERLNQLAEEYKKQV